MFRKNESENNTKNVLHLKILKVSKTHKNAPFEKKINQFVTHKKIQTLQKYPSADCHVFLIVAFIEVNDLEVIGV